MDMATGTTIRAITAKKRDFLCDARHFTEILLFSIFGLKSIGLV